MNLKEALAQAREVLERSNVEDTPLESEILLRHVLGLSRARLYLDLDLELDAGREADYRRLVERRLHGEPTAYITGHREFYGLDFYVDERVLIPRPESELLVEKSLSLLACNPAAVIADIGTGCGAIAISLAKRLPSARIYAVDISAGALEVARANCRRHLVEDRVQLLEGDLLGPLNEPVDLVVANLPYVKEAELPGGGPLGFEPELALNGGTGGTAAIERLCLQARRKLGAGNCLLLEIGQGQGQTVTGLLQGLFPLADVEVTADFNGIDRVVSLCLTQV